MSTNFNRGNYSEKDTTTSGKVQLNELLLRIRENKRVEKKRNLALGVAAVSAVTVFGIILTI